MKNILTIFGLTAAMALSSCNDWLDVRPRTEMKEEDMYAVEDGFKSALTGAYIQLASSSLYGKTSSVDIPEFLARNWTIPSSATDKTKYPYNLANYNYTHAEVKPQLEAMWEKYYTCVAHLNNVLFNLKHSGAVFSYHNDKLIEGEALGLRAFIHLELLRFYGPVPSIAQSGDKGIPYVKEMTKDPNKLVSLTYGEVLEHILNDLDAAEEILQDVDPIFLNSMLYLNTPSLAWPVNPEEKPKDEWQFYRQTRLNYYAVLGIKARYYHWIGDKDNAVKYAKMVIEATNKTDEKVKFELVDESYYTSSSRSLVMFPECLFAVENPDLQKVMLPLFKEEDATLQQKAASVKLAYESDVHPDDIRNKGIRYWEEKTYQNSQKVNHFRKYTGSDYFASTTYVPLLRAAEMYLILIEDLPLEEAKAYFHTYRVARNLTSIVEDELVSENAVLSRLEKEYRKEFFGEGQMFFFYKRHNYKEFSWPGKFAVPDGVYVLPFPDSQTAFE